MSPHWPKFIFYVGLMAGSMPSWLCLFPAVLAAWHGFKIERALLGEGGDE